MKPNVAVQLGKYHYLREWYYYRQVVDRLIEKAAKKKLKSFAKHAPDYFYKVYIAPIDKGMYL